MKEAEVKEAEVKEAEVKEAEVKEANLFPTSVLVAAKGFVLLTLLRTLEAVPQSLAHLVTLGRREDLRNALHRDLLVSQVYQRFSRFFLRFFQGFV